MPKIRNIEAGEPSAAGQTLDDVQAAVAEQAEVVEELRQARVAKRDELKAQLRALGDDPEFAAAVQELNRLRRQEGRLVRAARGQGEEPQFVKVGVATETNDVSDATPESE